MYVRIYDEQYNLCAILMLLFIALRLDGYIGWSWVSVLFMPFGISFIIKLVAGIFSELRNRGDPPSKTYGSPLYWDGVNKRMYGPFNTEK